MDSYRPQLDSLRAFAVGAVLLAHFWLPQLHFSTFGVRLFFVLSGFLLTTILLRERRDAEVVGLSKGVLLKDFYVRRILRIWPAYYAAIVGVVLMGSSSVEDTFAWHALFASNILFFQQQQWYPPVTSHLWTLSVEEQFYLLLPIVILFLPQRRLRTVFAVCIATAIAYRAMVAITVTGMLDFYYLLPVAQLDALGGGALLALIQHQDGAIDWKRLLSWSLPLTVLLYVLPLPIGFDFTVALAMLILPLAAIVAAANAGVGGLAGAILSSRPLVALGRISYGIYLYICSSRLRSTRLQFPSDIQN